MACSWFPGLLTAPASFYCPSWESFCRVFMGFILPDSEGKSVRDELCCGRSRRCHACSGLWYPVEVGHTSSTLLFVSWSLLSCSLPSPPTGKLFLLLLCPILLPPPPDPSGMHTETMKNWLRSSKRRLVSGLIRHCHHFCLEVPIIVVNKVLGYEERHIPGKSWGTSTD